MKKVVILHTIMVLLLLTAAPGCAKAVFEPSNLTVTPQEVEPGHSVTVAIDVKNTGGAEGTYAVALKVDGLQTETKSVTVAAAATQKETAEKVPIFFRNRDLGGL